MYSLLLSSVPYDTSMWVQWWNSIMRTIGAASSLGMVVFIALCVIGIFKTVLRFWF